MTPKVSRQIANTLHKKSREFLILHVAGPVPIVTKCASLEDRTPTTRKALIERGLIQPTKRRQLAPTHTEITELGRWVACAVLADIADMLANTIEFIKDAPPVKPETPAGDALLRLLVANHRDRATIS